MAYIIALIGEAGSGKTTLTKRLLNEVSCHIISGDEIGHRILRTPDVIRILSDRYPETLYIDDEGKEAIHRGRLGNIVFSSPENLIFLNRVTHPKILAEIKREIQAHKDSVEYLFLDGAALIEIGAISLCDRVIYVFSSKEVRLDRLIHFRKIDHAKALAIIEAQQPSKFYQNHADFVLNTDQGLDSVFPDFMRYLKELY